MTTTIIGIDCATKPSKIGLALAHYDGRRAHLLECRPGGTDARPAITEWIQSAGGPALLALDAPLGWPSALGAALNHHKAGDLLEGQPDILFSRETDRTVWREVGKRPLEVGANLIARTAHSALTLLRDVRGQTGLAINLAWSPERPEQVTAIEVYPAATLAALHPNQVRYGHPPADRESTLGSLLQAFPSISGVETHRQMLLKNEHVFDAFVCVLAGLDFLEGRAQRPNDLELARREGWIWVRSRGSMADQINPARA